MSLSPYIKCFNHICISNRNRLQELVVVITWWLYHHACNHATYNHPPLTFLFCQTTKGEVYSFAFTYMVLPQHCQINHPVERLANEFWWNMAMWGENDKKRSLIFHEYIKDTQQVINADIWKVWKGRKYIQANLFVRDGFASNDENDSRPQFLIGC